MTIGYQIIAILPFISFKEKIIRLDKHIIFADSKISEIIELDEKSRQALDSFVLNQKNFIENTFKNKENEITFVLPTDTKITKRNLESFLEILFFCLHKGEKFTYFFSAPNIFCKEDFKSYIVQIPIAKGFGPFFAKKRFKFQFFDQFDEFVISPSGCENLVTQNQLQGYIFRDIPFDQGDRIFQFVYKNLINSTSLNLLRSIGFYNKTLSCELRDEERFVWLSSALESFLHIEKQNDKSAIIKQEIREIIFEKGFIVLNKNELIENVNDLITVIYDYRSSYVHGGDKLTESQELENKLKEKLGNLDLVLGLMNLTSYLLVHNVIPDNRLEGLLNVIFYNQNWFRLVVKLYQDSADTATVKLKEPENILTIQKFLFITDLQTISFKKSKVKRCLTNILYIFAKFANQYQDDPLARQIQRIIDDTQSDDEIDILNNFLEEGTDFTYAPDWLYFSSLVFKRFYQLLKYEYGLY